MPRDRFPILLAAMVLLALIAGGVWLKYLVWHAAHPDAPFWTFLLGG